MKLLFIQALLLAASKAVEEEPLLDDAMLEQDEAPLDEAGFVEEDLDEPPIPDEFDMEDVDDQENGQDELDQPD